MSVNNQSNLILGREFLQSLVSGLYALDITDFELPSWDGRFILTTAYLDPSNKIFFRVHCKVPKRRFRSENTCKNRTKQTQKFCVLFYS